VGWNDRLPEDPNWPFPSQADSDAYEAWHEYMLSVEAELTSQNIDPAMLAALQPGGRQTELPPADRAVNTETPSSLPGQLK
jgi:hypothetical protein